MHDTHPLPVVTIVPRAAAGLVIREVAVAPARSAVASVRKGGF